jgi:predicted small secreted protein
MLRPFITIAICAFFLTALAGCNTVQGMGKDIEKAGEKTQEAADAVRKKL